MKSLQNYQQELLEVKNAEIKQDGYEDNWLLTKDDLLTEDLLNMWMMDNPRPDVIDHNNAEQALECALWMLERDDFINDANGEGVCCSAKNHKNAIIKAIESRCKHCTTAWQAAYEYAENRPDVCNSGQDQEG